MRFAPVRRRRRRRVIAMWVWFLLFALPLAGSATDANNEDLNKFMTSRTTLGVLDARTPAGWGSPTARVVTVTVARGGNATLNCTVLHPGDTAVSWVRTKSLAILAHAGFAFTADTRVAADVTRDDVIDRATHRLMIANARAADAGRYECQLNTEPKRSLFFDLAVVDSLEEAEVMQHDEAAARAAQRRVQAHEGTTGDEGTEASGAMRWSSATLLLFNLALTEILFF